MNLPNDLKTIEGRAFRSTFQDGLWDLWVAQLLLVLSIVPLLGDWGFSDLGAALAIVPGNLIFLALLWLGKKWITAPRLGSVRFSERRQARSRMLLIFSALLLAILVLWWSLPLLFSIPMAGFLPITIAVFFLVNFSLLATLLNLPRFYFYGLVAALATLMGDGLYQRGMVDHHGWPFIFGVPGALIGVIGLVLLVRFIRMYPAATTTALE